MHDYKSKEIWETVLGWGGVERRKVFISGSIYHIRRFPRGERGGGMEGETERKGEN